MIVDVNNFSNSAYELSQNMSLCNEMGSNAYHTIHDEWNYAVAAKRLAEFINSNTIYDDGPLSYNEWGYYMKFLSDLQFQKNFL